MKNGLLITILSLLFVGCSHKVPALNNNNNNISDANEISPDTVSIDDHNYDDSNNMKNNNILSSNVMNNSSDGFRSIYFAFDKYNISSNMQSNMSTNIKVAKDSSHKIKLEGNCDEFGTDEYNYALGLKRAKAVKDEMVSQSIAPAKMIIISFGESNPVCKESTNSCYERNRRVDIHLLK